MWHRTLAFLLAALALTASVYVYTEIRFLGFPDGYLTDFDRAIRILGILFVYTSFPTGIGFAYLGWIAPSENVTKRLYLTIAFYSAFVIIASLVYFLLRQALPSGGGG